MRLSFTLLSWLWRSAMPVTLVAMALAITYTLFAPGILGTRQDSPWRLLPPLLAFLQCVALAICFGRTSGAAAGFLYTRGFSRDRLWAHTVLASVVSVAAVWLAAALLVWLPGRSFVQDRLLESPYYPGASHIDRGFYWPPLVVAAVLLPPLHYVWIRFAQPVAGHASGLLLASAMVIAVVIAGGFAAWRPDLWWIVAVTVGAALLLFIWGWRLHRRVEVYA